MSEITCKFKYQCPKKWEELKSTDSKDIKFCDHCSQNVYFAENHSQFDKFAAEGKCVAIEIGGNTIAGEPGPIPSFKDIGEQ